MNLYSACTLLEKTIEETETRQAEQSRFYRDEQSNLYVLFNDDDAYKFPLVPFRPYQLETQQKLFHERILQIFLVRPRRSGKELESWSLLVQAALEEPGLYLMIYPTNVRARMVLWDGAVLIKETGRSVRFRDMIPPRFLAKKPNDAEMTINFTNGSIIWVLGSDIDPDKLRGVNARGVVNSEFAYSDPRVRHILMPMLRQNGGWILLQTTYNGMNHAYQLMQDVKSNPAWYCRVDTIETLVDENGNRYITDEMIEEDRKSGMPEFMIQQEYYSAVELNQDSLYFANELNMLYKTNRIVEGLYFPNQRVRMHMDIGMNDKTAIILEQHDRNFDPVCIAYHENNNKRFEYYVRWAEQECAKRGLVLSDIYAPHDGEKRDWGTAKKTEDYGREMGYNVYTVKRPAKKYNAIQAMRRMLYRTTFNKENTTRLIDCLSNYSKDFDEKRGVYKNEPLHNWATHGVDSFQTLTLAYDAEMINAGARDIVYYNG